LPKYFNEKINFIISFIGTQKNNMQTKSRVIYEGKPKTKNTNEKSVNVSVRHIIAPISIGQSYHEDGELKKGLEVLHEHFQNLSYFHVIMADKVQCYSLAIKNNTNPESMFDEAKELGKTWKLKYENTIRKEFEGITTFTCWDDWVSGNFFNAYNKQRDFINKLYQNKNSELYKAIEEDILIFEKRRTNKGGSSFTDEQKGYCSECLLQELAVLLVWWTDLEQKNIDTCGLFYPKPINKSVAVIIKDYTQFVPIRVELKSNTHKVNKTNAQQNNPNTFYKSSNDPKILEHHDNKLSLAGGI
jgi:hypothetical protein